MDFLHIVNNKKHPEYKEMREWADIPLRGRYNDEASIDIEMVNTVLNEYFQPPDGV